MLKGKKEEKVKYQIIFSKGICFTTPFSTAALADFTMLTEHNLPAKAQELNCFVPILLVYSFKL